MADTKKRPDGLDSPMVPKLMKYAGKAHVWTYRRTNGLIGSKWRIGAGFRKPVPTLLLDHRGRTSGKSFTTPLLYMLDGPDVIVVGSQGGLPKDPQWYRNLVATPDTQVQIKGERRQVRARTANAEERAALWPRLVEVYADFASYQAWTEREIPVVILAPRG
ncbi:nitroreductase family deazaflavin-dependent oxidoreductase [Nocardioides marmoriginsengisoli]|uniref:Nitroreductase family deazaflavin-dependent oxidoreductase n=1 Tax=Nocardioides marmoriginsengisoli TaxID=661483 RepID=A0A3N0CHL4_9ACTN|nr:nitroreductase family deazaflavin-dependent oxidoreductase [Nocardioides marmoriginsengisoli]RNL62947.1 nitroreductase family deazaflavin-dependent oxidoreductase [Nocardioides marmoriginsengisoli]